jgi:2-C-methyl-D-erythritol 4-phosphate cytidylyltransferase
VISDEKVIAVLMAAGSGSRVGAGINKVLLPIGDDTILGTVLGAFLRSELFSQIVVVTSQQDLVSVNKIINEKVSGHSVEHVSGELPLVSATIGGASRQESVRAGLKYAYPESSLSARSESDIVVIHDAARCFVTRDLLARCISSCRQSGATTAGLAVVDSLLSTQSAKHEEVNRDSLWSIQTPQVFSAALLLEAHDLACRDGFIATDDASLVRRLQPVAIVEGERANFKITTADDYSFALSMLGAN